MKRSLLARKWLRITLLILVGWGCWGSCADIFYTTTLLISISPELLGDSLIFTGLSVSYISIKPAVFTDISDRSTFLTK
jgi:hypothetical protein